MSCCPHCHWHACGYPYAAPPTAPSAYYPPPEPPARAGRTREVELTALVQNLQEELGAVRRELDELRRTSAR